MLLELDRDTTKEAARESKHSAQYCKQQDSITYIPSKSWPYVAHRQAAALKWRVVKLVRNHAADGRQGLNRTQKIAR